MSKKYDAEQSEVWKDVKTLHKASGTTSFTGAMRDAFAQKQTDLDAYLTAFPLQDGQKGMVVLQNGEIIGADYISQATAYKDLHGKLIRSHAIDAVNVEQKPFDTVNAKVDAFQLFNSIKNAEETEHQPVGLGKDIRYKSDRTSGSALIHNGEVIHLSVFPKVELPEKTSDFDELKDLGKQAFSLGNRIRRFFEDNK